MQVFCLTVPFRSDIGYNAQELSYTQNFAPQPNGTMLAAERRTVVLEDCYDYSNLQER